MQEKGQSIHLPLRGQTLLLKNCLKQKNSEEQKNEKNNNGTYRWSDCCGIYSM